MGVAKTIKVSLKLIERTEVTYEQPNASRLPKPRPNLEALPKLKALQKNIGSVDWWDAWFEYLSKDKKDRENIRDLILSKLPPKKLFLVGCVPSYKETMFNYAKNPFLRRHLCHKKQYFLTTFCRKEIEKEENKDQSVDLDEGVEEGKAKDEEIQKEKEKEKEARKSVKSRYNTNKKIEEDADVLEIETFVFPEFDNSLEGVDLEDAYVQVELLQADGEYVKLGKLSVRGENDNYTQLKSKPYVQFGDYTTKKGDLAFGTATLGLKVVSLNELLRKVQAYDLSTKKWTVMPSLNFLPPRVNGMLAGEGGLLLLSGDIPQVVYPNAPKPVENKPEDLKPIAEPSEGESLDGAKKLSIKPGDAGKKPSIKPDDEPPPLTEEEGESVEGDNGAESKKEGEDNGVGDKKPPPIKEVIIEQYKLPEYPPQHLFVVCNPIARTFRVLPPIHVNLEKLVARLVVNPSSSSYVAYVIGFHRRIKECIEAEGMRVAIYKSVTQHWHVYCVPACRIFRPGQCCYSRALPLVTKLCEGPTLFIGGEIVTRTVGVYQPVVLGYRLRTKSWKAYAWPPLTVTEGPQVLEVNDELYILARGASEPATINIWKFYQFVYEVPDCKQVTMMPQDLFSKCFIAGHRKAAFDCVSSMDCISIVSREAASVIISYNVKTNKWLEPMKRYPGFMKDFTFLGNWSYEPTPYALV